MTQPPYTNHFTTVTPTRAGWLVQEYREGRGVRAAARPTQEEADTLAAQWREEDE